MKQDRYYQAEAHEALKAALIKGINPIVSMATGTGKSHVQEDICTWVLKTLPGTRVMCITHESNLIEQNHSKMPAHFNCGIYSAGLGRRNAHNSIIFAGIQSVYKKANLFAPVGLVIIDEVQLLSPDNETMYASFIKELKLHNKHMLVMGMSATPWREKEGLLTDCTFLDEIVYEYSIADGIRDGYLSPLVSKGAKKPADVSKVKKVAGEFHIGQMESAFDDVTKEAIDEIIIEGVDRKCWLIFCVNISHCHHVSGYLNEKGISHGIVTKDTSRDEKIKLIKQHKSGQLQALLSVKVLTIGYDNKHVDLIALLRSTYSVGLYVQIDGRGTRPVYAEGFPLDTAEQRHRAMSYGTKPNGCLILDYGGNIERFGPVDKICITPKVQRDGTVKSEISVQPTKLCPECRHDSHVRATTCAVCGYQWPLELNHDTTASSAAILSVDIPEQKIEVKDIFFYRHKKAGKPDSMKVTYIPMGNLEKPLSEWVPFESGRKYAVPWWDEMARTIPPLTTDEALERTNEIEKPEFVYFKKEGKFNHVTRRTHKRRDEAES